MSTESIPMTTRMIYFFLFGHLSEILTNRPEGFPVSFFSDAQISGWGKFPLGGNIPRYTHQHGIIDFERISEGCMWKPDPQRFSTGCVKTPLEPYTKLRGFGGPRVIKTPLGAVKIMRDLERFPQVSKHTLRLLAM